MTKKEASEHNAVAWLSLTDEELARNSASLGHDKEILPLASEAMDGRVATIEELKSLRKAADKIAVEHAGQQFVNAWVKENR